MNRIDRYWDYHAMVKRNERIIRTLCLRYRGDDAEGCKDLAQEVRIGLWQRFMARSGMAARLPEAVWVYWNVRSIISHRRRLEHGEIVRLDKQMMDSIVAEDDHAAEVIDELSAHLTADEARLLDLLRQGYRLDEIAILTDVSVPTARSRREHLVASLRREAARLGMIDNKEQ